MNKNPFADLGGGGSGGGGDVTSGQLAAALNTHNSNPAAHQDIRQRVADEEAARQSADAALAGRIDDLEQAGPGDDGAAAVASHNADSEAHPALRQGLATEATTRETADNALGVRITAEATSREAADSALRARIAPLEAGYGKAVWGLIQGNIEEQADLKALFVGYALAGDLEALDVDFQAHKGNAAIHITSLERVEWNARPTSEQVDDKIAQAAIRVFNTDVAWEVPTRADLAGFIQSDNSGFDSINSRQINNFDIYLVLDSGLQFYFDSGAWVLFSADLSKYFTRQEVLDTFATKTEVNLHTADADIHVAPGEKDSWDGAVTGLASHVADEVHHVTSEERAVWNGIAGNPMDVVGLSLNSKIAGEPQGLTITLAGELPFPCRLQLMRKSKQRQGFIGNLDRAGGANLQGFQVSGWWFRGISVTAESVFDVTPNGKIIPAGTQQFGLTGQEILNMYIPSVKRGLKNQDWRSAWTGKPPEPITRYVQGITTGSIFDGMTFPNAVPPDLQGDILVDIAVPLGSSTFAVSGIITAGVSHPQVGATMYYSSGSQTNTQPVVIKVDWGTRQLRIFPLPSQVDSAYQNTGRQPVTLRFMPLRHIRPRHNAEFSQRFMPPLNKATTAFRASSVEYKFRLIRLVPVSDGRNQAIFGKASDQILKISKHASTHDGSNASPGSERLQMRIELS